MASATRKVQFEIDGVTVGALTVTIKVNDQMLPYCETHGYSGEELTNFLNARVVDAIEAMDGCVKGVIVSNLEGL